MSDPNIPDWARQLTPADVQIEGPGPRPASSAMTNSPRKSFAVVSTPRPLNDYEGAIAGMRNEITDLVDALCVLRAEAEQFVEWRHGMGEGTGAPSWGLHQQTYSAELHLQHRARAAKLKMACEHRSPGNSDKWIDKVLATPGRYGDLVTKQAREELGL